MTTKHRSNLDYIKRNVHRLDEYDVDSLAGKLKLEELREHFPHVSIEKHGDVNHTDISLDLSSSITVLRKALANGLKAFAGEMDVNAYLGLGYVAHGYYMRHKGANRFSLPINCGHVYWAGLLNLLIYVMEGTVEPDLARANEAMKALGLQYNKHAATFDYLGVKVKAFKNGRLDLTFPKPEQLKHTVTLLEQWHDAERRSVRRRW